MKLLVWAQCLNQILVKVFREVEVMLAVPLFQVLRAILACVLSHALCYSIWLGEICLCSQIRHRIDSFLLCFIEIEKWWSIISFELERLTHFWLCLSKGLNALAVLVSWQWSHERCRPGIWQAKGHAQISREEIGMAVIFDGIVQLSSLIAI